MNLKTVVDFATVHLATVVRVARVVFVLGLLNMAFRWFLQGSVSTRSIALTIAIGALLLATRRNEEPI